MNAPIPQRWDYAHVGLHSGVVIAAALTALWPEVYTLDPITAGAVSVLWAEAEDVYERGRLSLDEIRDLFFRSLGAVAGWIVVMGGSVLVGLL